MDERHQIDSQIYIFWNLDWANVANILIKHGDRTNDRVNDPALGQQCLYGNHHLSLSVKVCPAWADSRSVGRSAGRCMGPVLLSVVSSRWWKPGVHVLSSKRRYTSNAEVTAERRRCTWWPLGRRSHPPSDAGNHGHPALGTRRYTPPIRLMHAGIKQVRARLQDTVDGFWDRVGRGLVYILVCGGQAKSDLARRKSVQNLHSSRHI